jgi:RND family efflux transporter MFP subunit
MRGRTRAVVVVAVVGMVTGVGAGLSATWRTQQAAAQTSAGGASDRQVPVVLTAPRRMVFESRLVVAGNVQAQRYALVSARMPGPLDAVYVDEGDWVEAGKTKMFQTDSLKLRKAVAMAQQGLRVAELSVHEKQASLEQVLADQEQVQLDLRRYQGLVRHHAVPEQQVEQQQSRAKQAVAMVKHAEALLALENTRLEQARLMLTMAEKDLADSLVIAPISGRVSRRFKEPGEMATAGTPVMKIEDPSALEVSAYLPEQYYAQVVPGQTTMRITCSGAELGGRPVEFKSPTVHTKLRTFEVKGLIEAPPAGVVPGCLAEVTVVLDSGEGLGVPSVAIGRRGGHTVVFVIDQQHARMVQIKTGRRLDGWTEVTADGLTEETPVITMGQHLVEEGTSVVLVEGTTP